MTTTEFRTVAADPPWQYRDKLQMGVKRDGTPHKGHRGAETHYPCMSLADIMALSTWYDELARFRIAPNAHLYLWTTNAFLDEAFDVARAWGFTTRTVLTWVKPTFGMGHYFRNNTEHVLFGVRGNLSTLRKNQTTSFEAPRGRHSEKPDVFFQIVESMSPGPYLELFSRRQRPGWVCWGNEMAAAQGTGTYGPR